MYDFVIKLKKVKLEKKGVDLEKYQNNLIRNSRTAYLSKDSVRKLNTTLRDLRYFY